MNSGSLANWGPGWGHQETSWGGGIRQRLVVPSRQTRGQAALPHLSNAMTKVWQRQRLGGSGWTQRAAPTAHGNPGNQVAAWSRWGIRGQGSQLGWGAGAQGPPVQLHSFDDLEEFGRQHSLIARQAPPSALPFPSRPSSLLGIPGTHIPVHIPWGTPSPPQPLLSIDASSEKLVGTSRGPGTWGNGPGVPAGAGAGWMDTALPEAPHIPTARGSPPPRPPEPSIVLQRICHPSHRRGDSSVSFSQVLVCISRTSFLLSSLSPSISTLCPVFLFGGNSYFLSINPLLVISL